MRNASLALALAALTAMPGLAAADEEERRLPVTDPGAVGRVVALNDCGSESIYDMPNYYGDDCRRLKIAFGPIVVQPGKNDILLQPVVFEKPMWDGYVVRFKPGLVDVKGDTPPVENLHLHHGTWLNQDGVSRYGDGTAWLATGEEKTIAQWPYRYGMKMSGRQPWLFLHMVHSAVTEPTIVYATYDIDYIEVAAAESTHQIRNTRSIWLDVGLGQPWGSNTQNSTSNDDQFPFNPVYNTNAGYGSTHEGEPQEFHVSTDDADAYGLDETRLNLCSWPDDNCARENSSGRVSRNQGNDISAQVDGSDWTVPSTADGTLVVMGGHLHMGGTSDTVELVRTFTSGGKTRRFSKIIHVSDAYYWNWDDSSKVGAPPISWDVSMTGVTADIGWKVRIKQGDRLRLNADYDTSIASWYENMGIVMGWVAPGDDSGIDPFRGCVWDGASSELTECEVAIKHTLLENRNSADVRPTAAAIADIEARNFKVETPAAAPGYLIPGTPDASAGETACVPGPNVLCTRGQITHPHIASSSNHRGCREAACADDTFTGLPAPLGVQSWRGGDVTEIHMAGFKYVPGDFSTIKATGVPKVKLGDTITFYNEDTPLTVPHTATACKYPCGGGVSTHYPIPNGAAPVKVDPVRGTPFLVVDEAGSKALDTMDFDTTQLGVNLGTPYFAKVGVPKYELRTTRTGVFTYFCRIHPFMRGAFEVYDPAA